LLPDKEIIAVTLCVTFFCSGAKAGFVLMTNNDLKEPAAVD